MSTLSNITPTTGSGSQPDASEPTQLPEAQTGIIGLFEKLITEAISSDPNAQTDGQKTQTQTPALSVKATKEHPNAAQQAAAFEANLIKISNSTATAGKNVILAQIENTQAGNQTSIGTISKAMGSSKTEKNLPAQAETAAINGVLSSETLMNQMLATAIPAESHKPEAVPITPASFHSGTTAKTATVGSVSAQGKQVSVAVTKISVSDLSEEKDTSLVQSVASSKAALIENKNVELLAKNSGDSAATDPAETDSSKSVDALGSENATSNTSNSISNAMASQPGSHGTSIANQDMSMKQAEKANKIAGQTEKVLPGDPTSMVRTGATSLYSSPGGQSAATAADVSPASDGSNGVTSLPADSTIVPTTANVRSGMLERTQEMVTLNAVRLSDSGNNSMQVVIKPDAGTQLSLELRQQGGSVQVQAVLQQGDFNHLNQQWPELQQRLDQRGIQLAPLSDDGATANYAGSHETSQQRQNQPTNVVPEIALVKTPTGMFTPETAQTSSHGGWETWA